MASSKGGKYRRYERYNESKLSPGAAAALWFVVLFLFVAIVFGTQTFV